MKITEVKTYPVKSNSQLKAFVTITIDGEFVVKGLKIIEGKSGIFVSMPSEKGEDGMYYDSVFPITADCREYIINTVLEQYEEDTKAAQKKTRR